MSFTATAIINRDALINNYLTIKKFAPNSKVLAVLKANAYGHGLTLIAEALSTGSVQADAFGVARIDEALVLRQAGITKPIVLLEGFFNPNDLPKLIEYDLQTIVHNEVQLDTLIKNELATPIKVWLKIDTGMHRLGIAPEDFEYFYQSLTASNNVADGLVLISHLACADDVNNPMTAQQLAVFSALHKQHPSEASVANSAGICAWPASHYQWVRPGIMLYGVSPMAGLLQSAASLALKPVMTLQSSLIAIRPLKAGEKVGYGGIWQSNHDTLIGVVAIGYGDGYPRHADTGTPVLVNGRRVPLVGRVSMDMITVDLGINAKDKIGDLVTLWGEGLPIEEIALHATTIPYELLCNITRRVQVSLI